MIKSLQNPSFSSSLSIPLFTCSSTLCATLGFGSIHQRWDSNGYSYTVPGITSSCILSTLEVVRERGYNKAKQSLIKGSQEMLNQIL
ncbi:hypothetical protein AKJ16_DCAP23313, partial [Drosera capensis]